MNEIFQPFELNGHILKNRIVMPAMVTYHFGVQDGFPTEALIHHYHQRAAGGVAMIIVEACCVDAEGRLAAEQLGLWKDEQKEAHARLVSVVHQSSIPVLAQLHHAGPRSVTGTPAGPSGGKWTIRGKEYQVQALTMNDIQETRARFVQAALRAKTCGYDGIELHCCHSYLLCAFLSPLANKRTDQYGGDLENRMRLPAEIVQDIRSACGHDFLISVRMGYDEPDLDTSLLIAQEFERCGADLLHISTGFGSSGVMDESTMSPAPDGSGWNSRIWGAGQLRRQLKCPVLAVGGIRQAQQARQALQEGRADLIAVGRGLLCDPEWVERAKQDLPVAACKNCKICNWGRHPNACPGKRRTPC